MTTDVYDVVFPSPVSLEELALSTLSIMLWRHEINIHRANNSLHEFNPGCDLHGRECTWPRIRVKSMIHAPSSIISTVNASVINIGNSIKEWLLYHDHVFIYHRTNCYDVFNDFDDLVCDFDNTIHYDRTAKRMILSEAISTVEKFKIACLYSFKDDIVRIWPSVASNINVDEFQFGPMHFWISYLRPESRKPGFKIYDFASLCSGNWSTIEYLWTLCNENEMAIDVGSLLSNHPKIFFRYMLHKLDEYEIEDTMADLIFTLAKMVKARKNQKYVIAAWMHLADKLSEDNFFELFDDIFEDGGLIEFDDDSCTQIVSVLCKLWECTPDKLKRPVIQTVLEIADDASEKYHEYNSNPDSDFYSLSEFVRIAYDIVVFRPYNPLFLAILSDATQVEKTGYWNRNWIKLFNRDNFHQIMNTCFVNESEVIEFKKKILSDYKIIDDYCFGLLKCARFKQLNDFLNYLCSDELIITDLKKRILSELANPARSSKDLIEHYKSLNRFIESAYKNTQLASDFKKKMMSSPSIIESLLLCVYECKFSSIKNFVKKFVSSEEEEVMFKERFINSFREHLINDPNHIRSFEVAEFQDFLRWCLGNDEKVNNFKRLLPIDEIVRTWTQLIGLRRRGRPKNLSEAQEAFLKWYFITQSAVEEYKIRVIPKYARSLNVRF